MACTHKKGMVCGEWCAINSPGANRRSFPVRLLDKPFGVSTQYDKRCTAQQGEKTHV